MSPRIHLDRVISRSLSDLQVPRCAPGGRRGRHDLDEVSRGRADLRPRGAEVLGARGRLVSRVAQTRHDLVVVADGEGDVALPAGHGRVAVDQVDLDPVALHPARALGERPRRHDLGEPEHPPERDLRVGATPRNLEGDVMDHQRPRFSASIFFCAGERRASGSSPVSR